MLYSRCSLFICFIHGGLPGSSDGKESACNAGDPGWIPGLGRSPGDWKWLPTPVFLPGESHGQKNLVGYSPWGCKESHTTERLTHIHGVYICQPQPPNSSHPLFPPWCPSVCSVCVSIFSLKIRSSIPFF